MKHTKGSLFSRTISSSGQRASIISYSFRAKPRACLKERISRLKEALIFKKAAILEKYLSLLTLAAAGSKFSKHARRGAWATGFGCLLLLAGLAHAFPPAPHHTLQGVVRDEWGDPLDLTSAKVILETSGGVGGSSFVRRGIVPGANFQLKVAMDAGATSRLYKPTALHPFLPFTLSVQIGQTTYVPMQMTCTNFTIGQPGQITWIDLTLGVDSDCDGLPDAWELALLRALGRGQTFEDLLALKPDGDEDGNGLTNLQEYLAGTYAYDPDDGFSLTVIEVIAGTMVLEFLAVQGRTYSIEVSENLQLWTSVPFRSVAAGPESPWVNSYTATDVRLLKVALPTATPANRFFRAKVQ
jgi:hypothetical protein